MERMRSFLLVLGWVAVVGWIYLVLLGLELDWNLVDWSPRADWRTGVLLLGGTAGLFATWFLSGAAHNRVVRALCFLAPLALLGLGIYVLPPEPLTHGLFARSSASPLWYRGGRLLITALPALFWTVRLRR